MKAATFLHVLEGIGRAVDPRIGAAIDAGKALAHAKSADDRAAAILAEVDNGLQLAGDLSGKDAIADPALRALIEKYVRDGFELHAYIEAHKAAAAPAAAGATGSTGE